MTTELQDKTKERKEILLTELLGETVKVRGMGYKTMRRARVEVTEIAGGTEYRPYFNYEKEERQQAVELIKRLDVMTHKGWATVWDDGTEDMYLLPGEQLATSAKETGLKYKTGML